MKADRADRAEPAPTGRGPRASVVIPAHDEAAVIGRLLASIAAAQHGRDAEVVVVANGCVDATAEVARSFADRIPGLSVLETTEPGKITALRAGDDHASAFPRVYVDADVEFLPGALDRLIETLSVDRARVAAPRIAFDVDRASGAVRAFYRMFSALPYVSSGLVGLGVYGLSARGRERFGAFPHLTADDMFVQRLFAVDERVESAGSFVVRTPRTLGALIGVRTRSAAGYRQLNEFTRATDLVMHVDRTAQGTLGALVAAVRRRPLAAPDALVYLGVMVVSRLRSRTFDPGVWHRDETSRR